MELPQNRIAVIGGGVAGLTTAYTIKQSLPSVDVQLYEASPRLGGIIQTELQDGFLVEHGPDMVATEPDSAIQLIRQLGIEHEMIPPQATVHGAAVVQNGRLYRLPEGFVLMRPTRMLPMLSTPLLSMTAKARLSLEPLIAKRDDLADESIQSFVQRRLGSELLERIVQPLVGGIYTGDVAKLSMAATMPQFWKMEQQYGSLLRATLARRREGTDQVESQSAGARYEKFRSFRGGMQTLVDALAQQIGSGSLHRSTPIDSLTRAHDRWQLQFANGCTEQFDQVVLATPARITKQLLAPCDRELAEILAQIRYASSAVVVLVVPEGSFRCAMSVAGFVVPINQRRSILATSFTGDKFAGRTPAGMRLLRVFIGGELQPELLLRSDAELITLAKAELQELIHFDGRTLFAQVVRWNEAMPQYEVGHLQLLEQLNQRLSQHPGLTLTGNSYGGVGIAPTIQRAVKTAQQVVNAVQATV